MKENWFQQKQTVNDVRFSTIPKACNLYNNKSNFVSPIYTFSLAGNIIVYTPNQGENREKYFNHINYQGKTPTLTGNKHPSVHFFFHRPRLFHLSRKKMQRSSPSEVEIKLAIPAPTQLMKT